MDLSCLESNAYSPSNHIIQDSINMDALRVVFAPASDFSTLPFNVDKLYDSDPI